MLKSQGYKTRLVFCDEEAGQTAVVTEDLLLFLLALFCFVFPPVSSFFLSFLPSLQLKTRQLEIPLIKLIYNADQIFWLQPAVQFFLIEGPKLFSLLVLKIN